MGKGIDYSRVTQLTKRGGGGGRSVFLKAKAGKETLQVRVEPFDPGGDDLLVIDREIGQHYQLQSYGATVKYDDKGQAKSKPVKVARCAAVIHGQHEDKELASLLEDLAADSHRTCSDAEIEILARWCLFCAGSELLRRSEHAGDRDAGYSMRASRSHLLNVVHRNGDNPAGEWKLLELPPGAYRVVGGLLTNPKYAGLFFADTDDLSGPARDLNVKLTNDGGHYEYSITPDPEPTERGDPAGKKQNLLAAGFSAGLLKCWSLDEQFTIIEGGTVTRAKKKVAPTGEPPRCCNKQQKDLNMKQCIECPWNERCDNPDFAGNSEKSTAPQQDSLQAMREKLRARRKQRTAPAEIPAPARVPTPKPVSPPVPVLTPLEVALRDHDWWHEMADQNSMVTTGRAELAAIKRLLETTNAEVARELWAKYAPDKITYPDDPPARTAASTKTTKKPDPAPAPAAGGLLARIRAMQNK